METMANEMPDIVGDASRRKAGWKDKTGRRIGKMGWKDGSEMVKEWRTCTSGERLFCCSQIITGKTPE